MKKTLSFLLCITMLIGLTPTLLFATTDRCPGVGATHTSANCDYVVSGEFAATCTEAGYVTGKCLTCNTTFEISTTAPTDHDWVQTELLEPIGCTPGHSTYTCTNCGDTKTEQIYKTAGIGHNRVYLFVNYSNIQLKDGSVLNSSNAFEIKTEDIVLANGVIINKDEYNQAIKIDNQNPNNPEKPSCKVDAKEAWFCTLCGEVGVDTVPASRYYPYHTWTYVAAVAPTCEKPGNIEYEYCSYCGDYRYNTTGFFTESYCDFDGTPIYNVLNVSPSAYVITDDINDLTAAPMHHVVTRNYVLPTCTRNGSRNYYCEDCNAFGTPANMSFEIIAKQGHVFFDELSAAEQNYYVELGKELAVAWGLIGYDFIYQVNNTCGIDVIPATCTSDEITTYFCHRAGCGEMKQVKTGDPIDHVVRERVFTWPTCTTSGTILYDCEFCGEYIDVTYIEPLGHDMSVKFWITNPTCRTEGKYILTCSVPGCDYYAYGNSVHVDLSENILTAPKDHVWVERGMPYDREIICATLGEDRKYDRECTVCGIIEYDYVAPAVEHVFYDFYTAGALGLVQVGIWGDCETQGVYYIPCETCVAYGAARPAVVKYLDPNTGNGHNKVVLFEAVEATCVSEGFTEGWMCTNPYCAVQAEAVQCVQPLHYNEYFGLLSIQDMLINKNMIDLYEWDLAARKLGVKFTDVYEASYYGEQRYIVAIKRGARIVNGLPEDPNDWVKEVDITDNVKWVFYVPGSCDSYGIYGGLYCTKCQNSSCVGPYDYNSYCGITNRGDGGHVWIYKESSTMSCEHPGYDRQICKFCDTTRLVNYVSIVHKNSNGFDIINSCIDRTTDRYCVLCSTVVPKDHSFGAWIVEGNVATRTCYNCATIETQEIEPDEPDEPEEPEYIAGDIDGNSNVDTDDAIYLLLHCFYPEDYEITQSGDIDGDGDVDTDDAIYLLLHVFYPDDYPLS